MKKNSITCPACNGSQSSEVEFSSYRSGNSSSIVGPGLMRLSDAIPLIVCLCGNALRAKSAVPQPLFAHLQKSFAQAQINRNTCEERLQRWASHLVDASELDKYNEDVRRLEQLAKVKPSVDI